MPNSLVPLVQDGKPSPVYKPYELGHAGQAGARIQDQRGRLRQAFNKTPQPEAKKPVSRQLEVRDWMNPTRC